MNWLLLSLGCAFFTATAATFSKLLLRTKSILFVGWVRFAVTIPLFLVLLFVARPSVFVSSEFWKTVVVLLPLELSAFFMYLAALRLAPLSLTFPFLGLTPVFSLFFSCLLLNERPGPYGMAGVALVSLGAYLLNAHTARRGFLEPFKSIYREKGVLLMVAVACIFGLTSVLGKRAVLLSGPLYFAAVYYSIFLVILTPPALASHRGSRVTVKKNDILLCAGLGISFALALLFHFHAIVLTNVAYMISVKRLSLLISVLYGAFVFKEKNIRYRLAGSAVILGGIALISVAP
jgi:drug/metabolite transporter (DMT)-like permease